jgi:hypothetical protein
MPVEGGRTTKRKKVMLPSGEEIYIPVITQISFIDAIDRGQETQHTIDNSLDSNRIVHVDQVFATPVDKDGTAIGDPAQQDTPLYVERIDVWKSLDVVDRGQESEFSIDNRTGNDTAPPRFTNHQKTHVYRYFQDPENPDDNGTWIDAELIDQIAVVDPADRAQETIYALENPTNTQFRDGDLSGQASPEDPDITNGDADGEGTVDNPIRTDPFQNIINFSSGHYLLVMQWEWYDWHLVVVGPPAGPPFEPPYTVPTDLSVSLDATTGDGIDLLFSELVVQPNSVATGVNKYILIKIWDMPSPPGNFTTDPSKCFTFSGSVSDTTGGGGSADRDQRYTQIVNTNPSPPSPIIKAIYETLSVGPYPSFTFKLYSTNDYEYDADLWNPLTPEPPIRVLGETSEEAPGAVFDGVQGAASIRNTPPADSFYNQPNTPPFAGGPQGPDESYVTTGVYKSGLFEFKVASLGQQQTGPHTSVNKIAAWPSLPVVRLIVDGSPTGPTYPPNPAYSLGLYTATGTGWLTAADYKFGGPPILTNKYTGTNP